MKKEIVEKLSILTTSAFGLVAALAWNSAIQKIFKRIFGGTKGMIPMIIYALIVTLFAVIATIWIGKISDRLKK